MYKFPFSCTKGGEIMAHGTKRLLANVPISVGQKVKSALALKGPKGESMQDAIVKSLIPYLGIDLTPEELETLNLLNLEEMIECKALSS